jgi:ATP-binding cassette subfamily B protein
MLHPSIFRRYLTILSLYLKPQWLRVLLVAVTLLLASGEQLVVPQLIRMFIDTATHRESPPLLLVLALSSIGVIVFGEAFSVVCAYFSANVAWTATNNMRRDLIKHCLSLDMSFHKSHPPGELMERIDGDVAQLSTFFSQFMFDICRHGIVLVAVLALLYTIVWSIGATVTLFVVLTFVLLTILRRRSLPLWEQNRQINASFSNFLSERLGGIEDIRANGAVSYTMQRFLHLLRQRWSITRSSECISQIQFVSVGFLLRIASVVALAQGAYLWSINLITLGTVYLIASYTSQLIAPIAELNSRFQSIQQIEACVRRIDQLFMSSPAQQDGPGCTFSPGALSISFERVTFGYVPEKKVLSEVTFKVQPGKVLGLIGRTGSGKTTIAQLLFRLYDPQDGVIRVDEKPLQQAKLYDLRQHIGMITQSVQLFEASVRDNVTFFDRSIPDMRILEVLDDVGLHSWYCRLPNGLDTLLGFEGGRLSVGEAQLLALTRIFLAEPGIVILDEVSSHLDPATEALIERAIDKLLYQRTAIIIAHSLRTIKRADDILLLENGRIQEYGARVALAQDPTSRFSYLLQTGLEEVLT